MELTTAQKLALKFLAESSLNKQFYWTGGTLLSYHYLHHRMSLDIDFFSDTPFSLSDLTVFMETLKKKGKFLNVQHRKIFDRHEFLFENKEILRIEFVHYNHEKKPLGKRESLLGVQIDSLEDIAANKTFAYFDRNEPKDLFDIYFLLQKGEFSPTKLLANVQQKFGVSFDESSFWSEAFKSFPLLDSLKPLLLEKDEDKQKHLLTTIEEYFKEGSASFLRKNLE